MSKLIKNGRVITNEWKTLTLDDEVAPPRAKLPVGPVLVPLSVWRARRSELIHREYEHGWPLGVWLTADEDVEVIARDIDDFTVIALILNESAADRSLAHARRLREHYGYTGELRAVGVVSSDDLPRLQLAGFDAFAIAEDTSSSDTRSRSGLTGLFDFGATILHGSPLAGATA
ncbi:MAG TPA: DUF934 domain-containing protein [Gallionella sp.]|nr:DUF934 domain-containing protein [Gallionella sp.]